MSKGGEGHLGKLDSNPVQGVYISTKKYPNLSWLRSPTSGALVMVRELISRVQMPSNMADRQVNWGIGRQANR